MTEPKPASILNATPAYSVTVEAGNLVLTFSVAPSSVLVTMQAGGGQRLILQSVRIGNELQTQLDLTWWPREQRHTTLEELFFAAEAAHGRLATELGDDDPRTQVLSAVAELVQINLAAT